MQTLSNLSSSFRDPSGFVFKRDNIYYRQVNLSYQAHYDHLMQSGLYQRLVKEGKILPHDELSVADFTSDVQAYKIIKPVQLTFISYPYEWSFQMLKDAAMLTLEIARTALEFGMILKDATPFNVSFHEGKMVFIDTLSFEKWNQEPWIAYRQFCETFAAPLLIAHYHKIPVDKLLLSWKEGVPLSYTASILPWFSKWNIHRYLHIFVHAKMAQQKTRQLNQAATNKTVNYPLTKMQQLLDSLKSMLLPMRGKDSVAVWNEYYEEALNRDDYVSTKENLIQEWTAQIKDEVQIGADLGTNDGWFAKVMAKYIPLVIAADFDTNCIDRLYQQLKQDKNSKTIHPLVLDLSQPSPAVGVNNEERLSFLERLNVDLIYSLAVIHHLAIGKNMNWHQIASLYAQTQKYLLIEFVPKEDEKVQFLLTQKKDIYPHYTEADFLAAFSKYFEVQKEQNIAQSGRKLFLMKRK